MPEEVDHLTVDLAREVSISLNSFRGSNRSSVDAAVADGR